MYKRLLALLVFIPMFLLAWYVRNRQPSANSPDTRIANSRDDDRYPSDRPSRSDRRRDQDRRRQDDRSQDDGRTRNDARNEEPSDDRDDTRRRHQHHGEHASSQPGVFDFYLLNLSWSPEFCSTHPDKAECAAHPGFILHGLWPQNNDGSYPEHCSNSPGPSDPATFRDLYSDSDLLRHEWSTHGTCSGLSPEAFFAHARAAVHAITIPNSLASLNHQTNTTPDDILTQFSHANPGIPRGSLALSCGNNYLTAVEVCLDHDLHAIACSNLRSCRANSIRIVPPGGTPN